MNTPSKISPAVMLLRRRSVGDCSHFQISKLVPFSPLETFSSFSWKGHMWMEPSLVNCCTELSRVSDLPERCLRHLGLSGTLFRGIVCWALSSILPLNFSSKAYLVCRTKRRPPMASECQGCRVLLR